MTPIPTFWSRIQQARLVRVLAVYLAASWLLLQVTALLREEFQLPAWVTPFALLLLLIGLAIICATAWVQSHPHAAVRAEREEIPSAWEIDLGDMRQSVARGRLPYLTWARSLLGGAVAFSLLFGLAGVYVIVKDRGRTLGPPEAVAGDAAPGIAVLPFNINDAGLAKWREGMVDLLSTNLDGVTGVRAIDSRTVLARWRDSVRGDAAPDLATALEAARRTGARYALVGSAVSSGAGLRLAADVYDVASGRSLGEGQVEGPADSIFGLVDGLSIEVLRAILGGTGQLGHGGLARATTSSLPALKAYLEGETLFRRSDFKGAIAAYRRAVDADSTFALAYARLAFGYGWDEGVASDLAEQAILRAAGYADRLPEREAVLVRAQVALHEGTLDGIEPLRQAVRRYPDDAETWEVLGDSYVHLGPEAMIDWQEAEAALGKAVELDSSFAPAYIHLTEAAFAYRADSARAARLVEAYGRLAAGTPTDVSNRLALALVFGNPAARKAATTALDTLSPRPLGYIARTFLAHPRVLDLQARTLEVMEGRPEAGLNAWRTGYFNNRDRGRPRAAVTFLEGPDVLPLFKVLALGELHFLGYPVPLETLERELELPASDSSGYGETFMAGAYAADRGRWTDHEAALERIRDAARRAGAAGDSLDARRLEGTAQALEGFGAWKHGGKAEALALLESALPKVTGYGTLAGMNADIRWWLCELYEETGRPRDAERCFRSFYPTPVALYPLAKIYEELGDYAKARESYELFAIAWQDADPELQPRVAEARAAVQRLSSAIKE